MLGYAREMKAVGLPRGQQAGSGADSARHPTAHARRERFDTAAQKLSAVKSATPRQIQNDCSWSDGSSSMST